MALIVPTSPVYYSMLITTAHMICYIFFIIFVIFHFIISYKEHYNVLYLLPSLVTSYFIFLVFINAEIYTFYPYFSVHLDCDSFYVDFSNSLSEGSVYSL